MSPTCETFLTGLRNQVNAGGFINNQPTVDGDRRLAYTWAFSVGVKHELAQNMALSVDYVGNRGRNNTAVIDINEGPVGANGRITRLGVNVFDPNGELVPLTNTAARNTTYIQFLQQQTLAALNTDFDSLEIGLDKRLSNRWSGRVSYTLARCDDVGAIVLDSDPRLDYGRCARDNRHAFAATHERGRLEGPGRRHGLPRVLRLSDQRDDRLGCKRRRREQRPPEAGGGRHPGEAHSVGARLEGLRHPQWHPGREEGAPGRTRAVHLARSSRSIRLDCFWKSTT